MAKGLGNDGSDPQKVIADHLDQIKSLLVLLLTKGGANQAEIAKALAVSQPTVSRQFAFGRVEPLAAEVIIKSENTKG
jgi:predicted transcriptional regulator